MGFKIYYWVALIGYVLLSSCEAETRPRQSTVQANKATSVPKVLIGSIGEGQELIPILKDLTMLEALFSIDYHFPQDDLMFRKTPLGTYKPFQMEYDDFNQYNRRIYYLTALLEKSSFRKSMFIRFELERIGDSLYLAGDGQYLAEIATCSGAFDDPNCFFLFKESGFYDGCSCGDKTEYM